MILVAPFFDNRDIIHCFDDFLHLLIGLIFFSLYYCKEVTCMLNFLSDIV